MRSNELFFSRGLYVYSLLFAASFIQYKESHFANLDSIFKMNICKCPPEATAIGSFQELRVDYVFSRA